MATIHMARPTSPYTSSSSDTDSIIASVPSGTALRRLYFKTAKTSKMSNTAQHKNSSTVPKVIVMNSSCNSTINTSTESASTHLTNITTTTDTETCDSLDLGDGDIIEQREPLLSESQDDSLTLSGHQDSSSTMEDDKNTIIINANDDLEESITPLLGDDGENSRKEQILNARKYSILYPHTAPPLGQTTTESSFSFDPPPSPRSARSAEKSTTLFSFDPVAMVPSNELSAGNKSSTRTNVENKENVRESDMNKVSKNTNKTEIKRERRFSTKCELFTNIFSIKDSSSTANKEKNSDMSTKTSKKTNSAPVHRKNSSISQSKFDTDESSSTGGTTSDLTMFPFDREAIDYERIQRECFAVEEEFNNDAFIAKSSFPYDYDTEDSPSYEALDQQEGIFQQYAILSQQEKERQNKKREQSPAEMKTLSKIDHINRKLNETSALIHEQPSSGATSPIPDLKIDFFSEPSLKHCRLSREKMKIRILMHWIDAKKIQLRVVIRTPPNRLTTGFVQHLARLLSFNKYGSPHHTRSQSVKMPGSRASGRPNQLCLPQQRSRVASMPNTGVEEEYYRLRHFSITGKGIVNRGDSLKSRRSKSNNSVASSNSSTEHLTTAANVGDSARTSLASSRESSTSAQGSQIPYRVLMLGSEKVGKSSLVSQFMTSEYLHAYDTSIDDDSGEKSVSVLLSGEESEMTFIDHAYNEMTPENCLSSYDPHGFLVIYSSADKTSFSVAERILQALWTGENIAQKAVILVGNKADLARSRCVSSEEGKAMATAYDCKFIETSVGINHNVDELLVGLLTQIRLKLENPEKSRDLFRKRSYRKSKRRACSPLGTTCLSGNTGTNPSTPVGPCIIDTSTPPNSIQNSPRKYRGSRTSASLKVKGLLGRVWARDSKSKSCENLHVL
ncbi:CLUMA_CG019466, isoform A [Clunio marinus]|uniref:CLUMA_CG019466, isoform A n=1 Tax=Clunio marinus TaxID=568069 RepID=A0A1J1J318_9DIPT|nr:CLUMA_CG019466, isoform A [Clunio marinus]